MGEIVPKINIEALIEKYQNLIFSVCYKMTGDYFTAEDLTQETFLSAYRSLGGFDGQQEKAWICRIATNKCVDYLKSAKRRALPTEEEEIPTEKEFSEKELPENILLEKEVMEKLKENCRKLEPPYDEIALYYFYEEKKPEEIAGRTNRNLKTVQTQIYRAREKLRKIYGKGGDDNGRKIS